MAIINKSYQITIHQNKRIKIFYINQVRITAPTIGAAIDQYENSVAEKRTWMPPAL